MGSYNGPRTTLLRRKRGRARLPWRRTLPWLAVALLVLWPGRVAAHARLESSDPAANAVVPTAPPTVTLRFTEPLERSYSKAELFDQVGNAVPGSTFRFGDDRFTMVVDLPAGLANGTYSVLWRTLSEADGHTAQGYIAFTVGDEADVRTVVPPVIGTTTSGPPDWLRAVSRWLALLGLAASVAVWPVWLFVLRPAIVPVWQLGPALTRRVRALAVGALALAVVGSVVALVVQAAGVAGGAGLLRAIGTTLNETRYGTLWLVRIGLFLLYAAVLLAVAWWWPRRRWPLALLALGIAALLSLPFSLTAHAAAQPEGRATAVAADVLHLLAASLWVGGLIVLAAGLIPMLFDLTPLGRRAILSRALPRFSAMALIAWGVMGVTGLYSAWLNVGNLEALRSTDYGRSLTIKVALLVPLLALGGFNLLWVTRRIRQDTDAATAVWSRRFVAAVTVETVLVVLVYLAVGRLIGQPPARDALAQEAGRLAIELVADGQQGTLYVTPGAAGPNHYRLELGSGHDHASVKGAAPVEVVLRLQLPDHDTGQKEISLTQAAGNAFDGHGSEFAIAGEWEIEAIVRQSGQADWSAKATRTIGTEPPETNLPGEPWRFGGAGVAGLLLLTLGIAGLVLAWFAGRSSLRRESAGLATVALVFGAVLLLQARIAPEGGGGEAEAAFDVAAVARGQALFAANCVACHGEGGRGDGPAATGLDRPPADLTAAHAAAHRDEDYAYWIANGIAGSAMPAFADTLSDDEIDDVIAYVRSLQTSATPQAAAAAACDVEPRTLDGLRALTAPSPAADEGGGPTGVAGEEPGTPADAETVAAVTATVEQLVACSNAGDPLRRLALFSDANLRAAFPAGLTGALMQSVATPPAPAAESERVALLAVEDVRVLADGRVKLWASIDNPLAHTHGPNDADVHAQRAALILVKSGERWLIDEVPR